MTSGLAPERFPIDIASELIDRVQLGVVHAVPIRVAPASAALCGEMSRLAEGLVERWAGRAPSEIDALQPARVLYRALGIDPTKTRPSSEALLRRALRGRPLPCVLNAVDLSNLLALEFLLPIGLYDAAALVGRVRLRVGKAGESYAGIRKTEVHLEGRPVLVDDRGPFGNPTSDSLRSSICPDTRKVCFVVFAPLSLSRERMRDHIARTGEAITAHLGGAGVEPRILSELAGRAQ
jgi:DNA/RNA-binding domain of Phe-tRNA-synthetase-like protein